MKRFTLTSCCWLIFQAAFSQVINGPTNVTVGQVLEYTLDNSVIYSNEMWSAMGGTVSGQSRTNTLYKVNVTWTTAGAGKVTFLSNFTPVAILDVNVTGCNAPAAPTGTLSANPSAPTACGPRILTSNATAPSGTTWYWQTSPTGTDITYPSSYSATTSGPYYLRARANCGDVWSSSYLSISVTINPNPAPPALPQISQNTCGDKTLTRVAPPPGIISYWQGTSALGTSVSNSDVNYTVSASGTYYIRAMNPTTGCWSTSATGVLVTVTSPGPPYCSPQYVNYEENIAYTTDASGNPVPIAASRQYFDGISGVLQSQAKNYTANQVLALQGIKDRFGMPAATTLPAPINSTSFSYKYNFVTNALGQPYKSDDFDQPQASGAAGEIFNPKPVASGGIGTLGWYYSSSNNLETRTPTTAYPYSRTYAPEGPNPTYSKAAGAGDQFKMGSGHESMVEKQKFTKSELSHYFALKPYFVDPDIYENNLISNADASSTSGFTPNQNATLSAVTQNGQNYVKVVTNQTTSTPGVYPIGGLIPVTPGATYTYMVKGYKSSANKVFLYVSRNTTASNLVWPGAELPTGSGNEGWVQSSFTIGAGVTSIRVGLLFSAPITNGDSFFVNALILQQTNNVIGYKSIATSPDGKKAVSYTDLDGNTLATATLSGSTYDNWSYTYYNLVGQPLASVAPQGVVTSSQAYPQFVTKYKYDNLGRVIETTSVDEGSTRFVYSLDGKVRFSENEEQRVAPKRFSYTNYDKLGRLIESGEYISNGVNPYVFDHLTSSGAYSVLNLTENTGFTGVSRKLDATRCQEYTFIEYDFPGTGFVSDGVHTAQANLYGQVSKTENQNASTWYSYDHDAQLSWSMQNISAGNLGTKTVDYTYDFLGNVTQVAYQMNVAAERFDHHYIYDTDQRLVEVQTSFNGTAKTSRAKYYYYLHGPLKRVELGNQLQGIDYVYTIDGSLKSINSAEPLRDPGADGISGTNLAFGKDAFGSTLHYHDSDYSGASYSAGTQAVSGYTNLYGGMPKAQTWHTALDGDVPRVYAYSYDNVFRLSDARFGNVNLGTTNTITLPGSELYREGITAYDKNGNVQSLLRKGATGNVLGNYNYIYQTNTNKVDLINHNGSMLVNYDYNLVGQVKEKIEGGTTLKIAYNSYGLVKDIRNAVGDQLIISYSYDDRGDLVLKMDYSGGTPKSTYYVRDPTGNVLAIYEKLGAASIQWLETPIYGASRIGTYKKPASRWLFEVTDQLGNVRGLMGDPQVVTYSANMETSTNSNFLNYSRSDFDLVDHTDAGTVYRYSQLLNGGNNSQVGLAKNFEVFTGDKVKLEAYAKYLNLTGNSSNLPSFALALTTAFGVTPSSPGVDGMAYVALNNYGAAAAVGNKSPVTGEPKAFITILVFDKNFNLMDAAWKQIESSAAQQGSTKTPHNYLSKEVTINQPGYVYLYVSNENSTQVDVYYDDVTVTHTQSTILSSTDYYPFGLELEARDFVDEPYRYGYQGQFSEKDLVTGLHEFELRNYDARFGRWTTPDPYGQYPSPYVGMGNIPIILVDVTGGLAGCPPPCPEIVLNVAGANAQMAIANEVPILLNEVTIIGNAIYKEFIVPFGLGAIAGATSTVNYVKSLATIDPYINSMKAGMNPVGEIVLPLLLQSYNFAQQIPEMTTQDWAFTGGIAAEKLLEAYIFKRVSPSLGGVARGGRLGNAATRSQINTIATTLEGRGYTITGGGGRTAEEFLRPLGGGRKGGSFLDITATHPKYPTLRINTVDVLRDGITPTARELRNAARIRTQIGQGEHLFLIPKR